MQTITPNNTDALNVKRSRFTCKISPLNPTKAPLVLPAKTKKNWEHVRNLEKVLRNSTKTNDVNGLLSPNKKKSRNTLLGGLNLAKVWPEMKAAVEEMSPKNLHHLQRLLSTSHEYSPKNSLGSRWRELHGSDNWVGLLDPLDENLRRELVRYGEFVQAAYQALRLHPDPENGASPRHVALPDGSYKVTKSLYATSSVKLPRWIDDVAPDIRWMTQQTSCVGYVAVCDDPREIRRMGRRDVVIAFRGTATLLEWAEDFRSNLVPVSEPISGSDISDPDRPKVECGFLSLYRTRDRNAPSLAESVVGEVSRLVELYQGEELSISITGHSLGAALSLLAADDVAARVPQAPPVAVFSFGGPRVGNRGFAVRMESRGVKVLRVVNNQDVVTKVPGIFPEGQWQDGNNGRITGALLEVVKRNNPWAYSHVGTELRVDTRMSPYLKPNADVACCHALEAYLHLVDGFLASNCPFRKNAKRSLRKLLDEQRSNVKVLYTGKGNATGLHRFVLDNGENVLTPYSS